MNPAHTILGAELYAILKAVKHIENRGPDSQLHFILSDSQAALQCSYSKYNKNCIQKHHSIE